MHMADRAGKVSRAIYAIKTQATRESTEYQRGKKRLVILCKRLPIIADNVIANEILDVVDLADFGTRRLIAEQVYLQVVCWLAAGCHRTPFQLVLAQLQEWLHTNTAPEEPRYGGNRRPLTTSKPS